MHYEPWTEVGRTAAIKRLDFFSNIKKPCDIEGHNFIRSSKQNRALHLWFTQVSDLLNNKGITFESVAGLESMYTGEYIKVVWFKEMAKALFDIDSTTKLNSSQINQIFDVVSKHISEMTGEFIDFPSIENLIKNTK